MAVSGDAYIYHHQLDPLYASYYFSSSLFQKEKMKFITGTKVRRVSGRDMEIIHVPVPEMAKQKKIAAVLTSFHTLIKSNSSGLSSEIEARHKQYEYYRDRLLTFKELGHE